MPQTLILGIGNLLLSDEGFGVAALEHLREHYVFPPDVKLLDGGTQGLMLIGEILECDFLVVLDIALGGEKAGTIYLIEDDEIPGRANFRHSMHEADLGDILSSCGLAGKRPQALVFALEPFDYKTLHPAPTRQAQELLPEFCRRAVAELARRGIAAHEK